MQASERSATHGGCPVVVHGAPNEERLKKATETFMRKVAEMRAKNERKVQR